MHNDDSDDPYGFWNDEPTRPIRRAQVGTRTHADTQAHTGAHTRLVPVVTTRRATRAPEPPRPHNPLMKRVCVMVGSMLLLVPVALSLLG